MAATKKLQQADRYSSTRNKIISTNSLILGQRQNILCKHCLDVAIIATTSRQFR